MDHTKDQLHDMTTQPPSNVNGKIYKNTLNKRKKNQRDNFTETCNFNFSFRLEGVQTQWCLYLYVPIVERSRKRPAFAFYSICV